ncbi:hypothetical protein ACLOJK_039132 [Asimina triloba]
MRGGSMNVHDHVEAASESGCPTSSSCSPYGPQVRFPFRLTSQPERCGYSGFELTCSGNQTILHLPASSNLQFYVVESIDYEIQRLEVAHPQKIGLLNFVSNLNLSNSPYTLIDRYWFLSSVGPSIGTYDKYTLVNCSTPYDYDPELDCFTLYDDYPDFACEGSMGHRLFLLSSDTDLRKVPTSCNLLSSMGIKFPYHCSRFKMGLTVSIFLVIVATIAAIRIYESRKKEAEHRLKVENFLKDYKSLKPTRYTYAEIKKITNHFKSPLGQGGYGTVFKGNLPNGIPVAVKILKRSIEESEDFMNEVGTIGRIHHVNVVRLLGFCADGYERALVYEFMPNESLEKFIFLEGSKRPSLGWEKLQSIAIGIARGIEYLHQGCDQRILHFDIKPHNVLLDENFNPKITDFGLAKLCSKEQSIVSMSVAKGTMGYIAPEVISRSFGNVSFKSDVYSFGVLLLEMVRGRKNDTNANAAAESGRAHFPEWIYDQLHQGKEKELEITEEENPLVAKRLGGEIELEIVGEEDALIAKKLSIVALWCMQWYPVNRPSIQRAVQMLEGSIESLVMPPNPFGSTSQNDTPPSLCKKSQKTELTVIVE